MRPRLYQQELFEEACQRNVVAFLDTGAGKTLISVMLIKHKAEALRRCGQRKVTVFLAPKVDLVLQQASVLREHTGLETGGYVGSMGVDFWKIQEWKHQLQKHQIVVMTHQILLNNLRHAYWTMKDIGLLIFDECHHTKGNHPYNCIMKEFYYRVENKHDRPHIFGMTASPLDQKVGKDQQKIAAFFEVLEHNLDAKVITIADRTVLEEVAPLPSTEVLEYPQFVQQPAITAALGRLTCIGVELRLTAETVRATRQREALELQGLGRMHEAFDVEKIQTEGLAFSRHIGSVIYTAKDMGLVAAALCLSEVLKPGTGAMLKAKRSWKQQQEASMASASLVDDDLDLGSLQEDGWWDGHDVRHMTPRDHCTRNEICSLSNALWAVVAEFKHLLAPVKEDLYTPTSEEEVHVLTWPEICKQLRDAMNAILRSVDWEALDRQLIQPPGVSQEPDELQLVTSKVSALCRRLLQCKDLAEEHLFRSTREGARAWSCLIFCERRSTALTLDWFISHCAQLHFLRSAAIMGSKGFSAASPAQLKRQQAKLADMKANKLNTLVATSVAEEGLDLTQCRMVVRFDLPGTALEFIQSRGRARARDSRMLLMVEEGSAKQLELLEDVQGSEESMRAEALRRQLQNGSSEDEDDTNEISVSAAGLASSEFEYFVPSTGAQITLSSAKPLLYCYCSKLPTDKYTWLHPRFITSRPGGTFQTTVILPNNAPIQRVKGSTMPTKTLAVGSACLMAAKLLHEAGALNDNLLPEAGLNHSGRDAFAGLDVQDVKPMPHDCSMPKLARLGTKRPDLLSWPAMTPADAAASGSRLPMHLYRLVLTTEISSREELPKSTREKLSELEQLLGLLVPQPLPELPVVPMQLITGLVTTMELQYLGQLSLTAEQHNIASSWHKALCVQGLPKRQNKRKSEGDLALEVTAKSLSKRHDKAKTKPAAVGASEELSRAKRQKLDGRQAGTPSQGGAEHAASWRQTNTEQLVREQPEGEQLEREQPETNQPEAEKRGAIPQPEQSAPDGNANSMSANATTASATKAFLQQIPAGDPVQVESYRAGKPEDNLGSEPSRRPPDRRPQAELENPEMGPYISEEKQAWYCLVPLQSATSKQVKIDWKAATRTGDAEIAKRLDLHSMPPAQLEEKLKGCVIQTRYNDASYDFLRVREGLTLDSPLPSQFKADPHRKERRIVEPKHMRVDKKRTGTAAAEKVPKHHQALHRQECHPEAALIVKASNAGQVVDCKASAEKATAERPTFRSYYRTRWSISDLRPTTVMLECTSKEVQRRQEGMTGVDLQYGEMTIMLPPELCTVHPLKRTAVQIAKHVSEMLGWIHTLLLGVELREKVSPKNCVQPPSMLMAEALTPTNVQPDFSFERLETLGDSVLKYDCCMHVYYAYPKAHEGQLAEREQAIVSNRNLATMGYQLGLAKYIRVPADRFDWSSGGHVEVTMVNQKTVADCVEALIAAHFVAGGEAASSGFMRNVGLLPPLPPSAKKRPERDRRAISPFAAKLEDMLGYKFRNLGLLKEACTHCSWPDQSAPCYQRLEFLGDAVLDILIARYYICGYRAVEPGKMHDLRSASVNNTRLAIIAAWHRLHPFLRYFSTELFREIAIFVDSVKQAKSGKLEARFGTHGRRMKQFSARNYKKEGHPGVALRLSNWAVEQPPQAASYRRHNSLKREILDMLSAGFGVGFAAAPKVLSDLFESIMGAVFVDTGGDLNKVWQVVQPFLQPMVHPDHVPFHPVRALIELTQKAGFQVSFQREECLDPGCFSMSAIVLGQIIGQCKSAATREYARMLAAQQALEAWSDQLVKQLKALPEHVPVKRAAKVAGAAAQPPDLKWGVSFLKPQDAPVQSNSTAALKSTPHLDTKTDAEMNAALPLENIISTAQHAAPQLESRADANISQKCERTVANLPVHNSYHAAPQSAALAEGTVEMEVQDPAEATVPMSRDSHTASQTASVVDSQLAMQTEGLAVQTEVKQAGGTIIADSFAAVEPDAKTAGEAAALSKSSVPLSGVEAPAKAATGGLAFAGGSYMPPAFPFPAADPSKSNFSEHTSASPRTSQGTMSQCGKSQVALKIPKSWLAKMQRQ